MKTTVNKRLEAFISSLNISKVQFADSIGRAKQDIDRWINGGVKIPIPTLSDIFLKYPELNARWLITGEGEMSVLNTEVFKPAEHVICGSDDLNTIIRMQQKVIKLQDEKLEQIAASKMSTVVE